MATTTGFTSIIPRSTESTQDRSGPPRIGILGASFTTGNRGVDALAAGAIRCILHRFPEASVFFLDYAREPGRFGVRQGRQELAVELVNLRFSKRVYQGHHVATLLGLSLLRRGIPGRRWRQHVASGNARLRAIRGADLFCALSGGDSFSDLYGIQRLVYVALPQLLVLLNRKPLVLLPQSIGPFRSPAARTLARLILTRAERVYCREADGLDALRALLGRRYDPARCGVSPDVGFVVEPAAPARLRLLGLPDPLPPDAPLVGLNVSGLLARGGYTGRNMFGLRDEYRGLVERLVERLVEAHGALVLLVPHTFGPPGSAEADAPVCRELYEAFRDRHRGRVGLLDGEHRHDEIRGVLGRCDFFVGSRMHACVAALSQGVPTAAIGYSDKFQGVLGPLGASVLDARTLDIDAVLDAVGSALRDRAAARQILAASIPEVKTRVLGLFDGVPHRPRDAEERSRRPDSSVPQDWLER